METRNGRNRLARILAEESTKPRREPVVLSLWAASLGARLHSLARGFVGVVAAVPDILERALVAQTKSNAFCVMNPSEC